MAAARPPSSRPLWMKRPWAPEVVAVEGELEGAPAGLEERTTTVEAAPLPPPVAVAWWEVVLLWYEVGQATVLVLDTGQWVEVVVLWRLAGQLVTEGLQRVIVMVWVIEMVEVVVPVAAVVTALPAATSETTKARKVR